MADGQTPEATAKDGAKTSGKGKSGLGSALDKVGAAITGGRKQAGADAASARGLLSRWRPNRPQQLVLLGILAMAFLELRVASKFGDIWQYAFVGSLSEKKKGQHEKVSTPPPPDPTQVMIRSMLP